MTADDPPRNFLLRDLPTDVRTGVEDLAEKYGVSINAAFKIVLTTGLAAHRAGDGPSATVILKLYDDAYNVIHYQAVSLPTHEIRVDPALPPTVHVRAFGLQRG
jgi:hypothetical protein